MRIVCFGDTHGYHKKVQIPHGDMLIFAGDYTKDHTEDEIGQLTRFNEWLGKFRHSHKLTIAGNHDWFFHFNHHYATNLVTNATYLNDSMTTIDGLKIWGSPITPYFRGWAFNRHPGPEIQRHWDMIPDDIDILITHGPPAGILDKVESGEKVGSVDLKNTINERLNSLKLHVFGHIHPAWGKEEHNGVIYVNCSKGYHWLGENKPAIVVEI